MKLLTDITIAPNGGFKGFGPLGTITSESDSLLTFSSFISTVIGIMTLVAFIWFIISLFSGIISMIGSGGDKQAMELAKKKISNSIIGLIVTIAAIFIIDLLGKIFGIDILNFPTLFTQIANRK